jgi:hypothetical protein
MAAVGVALMVVRRAQRLESEAQHHELLGIDYAERCLEIRFNDNIDPESAQALAKYHRNLSDAYRAAVYRPWLIVREATPPEERQRSTP